MQFSLEKEKCETRKQQSCICKRGPGLSSCLAGVPPLLWLLPAFPPVPASSPPSGAASRFDLSQESKWEAWPAVSQGKHPHFPSGKQQHWSWDVFILFRILFIKILSKVVDQNAILNLSVRSYIYIYMAICTNIHVDILLCKVTATPGRSRTFNLIEHLKPNIQPLTLAQAQVKPGLLQDSLCVLHWARVEAMK